MKRPGSTWIGALFVLVPPILEAIDVFERGFAKKPTKSDLLGPLTTPVNLRNLGRRVRPAGGAALLQDTAAKMVADSYNAASA
jgi:hypothetical protein